MRTRSKVGLIISAAFLLYLSGYLLLSSTSSSPPIVVRTFPASWLATVYSPIAWMEAKVRGTGLGLAYESQGEPTHVKLIAR